MIETVITVVMLSMISVIT